MTALRDLRTFWIWIAAALALAGCGRGEPERVSAIVITVDSLRPDALGAYGHPAGLTPNFDRIAREGVLYTNARSVSPLTVPACASMMTGLYPLRHSARDNQGMPLADDAVTLAERAREAGFATAAVVGAVALDRGSGVAQGFEHYSQPPLPSTTSVTARYPERPAGEIAKEVLAWLAGRDRRRPFLLWVHFFDPNAPYTPPEATRDRAGGNPYLGEVAYVDEAIGEVWRALEDEGLLDRTFVVVASDYGEALGQHGEVSHGALCYDSTLRIPLILRYPDGARAGQQAPDIASLTDVYPTVLDALGIPDPGDVDGLSLNGGPLPPERGAYFESYHGYLRYGWSPITGWVDARGKYLHGTKPEFYDPATDPTETRDRIGQEAGAGRYRTAIEELAARPRLRGAAAVDEELAKMLAGLGYAAGGPGSAPWPEPLAETGLPDARTRGAELARMAAAMALGEQGRLEEAIGDLGQIVAENPRNTLAQSWLATYLVHAERCEQAIPILQTLVRAGAESGSTYNSLGHCLLERDDPTKALIHFRRATQLDPSNPIPVRNIATALDRLGRSEEAGLYWRRYGELTGG